MHVHECICMCMCICVHVHVHEHVNTCVRAYTTQSTYITFTPLKNSTPPSTTKQRVYTLIQVQRKGQRTAAKVSGKGEGIGHGSGAEL